MSFKEDLQKLNIIQLKQRINLLEMKIAAMKFEKSITDIDNKLNENLADLKEYGVNL